MKNNMQQNEVSESALADKELVRIALNTKSTLVLEKLMNKYRKTVYYMMNKMVRHSDDAEDLTLEAFAKAFNKLDKYNFEFAFSTWLFKIATNNAIDFLRKKRLVTVSIFSDNEEQGSMGRIIQYKSDWPNPEECFIKKERAAVIQNYLDKVRGQYKVILEKRYIDELSYEEIAIEMQMPMGSVKANISRAKEKFNQIIMSAQPTLYNSF
jgi:RNA polymerase sigma factor (sigma-70 family)